MTSTSINVGGRERSTILFKSLRPSHGYVAHSKYQQWILAASRCGHGQKRILFLKKMLPQTTWGCPMRHLELLVRAKSGHMPWALCDQVEEEGAAHRLPEVFWGESEEKQPPPIYAVCR